MTIMKFKFTLITLSIISLLGFLSFAVDDSKKSELEGIWIQEGYGRVIKIDRKNIEVYDLSTVSCVSNMTLPIEYLEYIGEVSKLTETSLTISSGINHLDFKRLASMPDICNGYNKVQKNDPVHNFESIWHTFNEQYCAFDKRGVDWMMIYKKYRSQVSSRTSEMDLFIIIEDMLDELNDGHVGLYVPDNIKLTREGLKKYADKNGKKPPVPDNSTLKVTARKSILTQYVGRYNEYNKGVLRYGMMDNGMVYLQINAMERWADHGLSEDLSNADFWEAYMDAQDEIINESKVNIDGANAMLDKVIDDTKNATAYILDIRFNGGGIDEVALAIMNHFAIEEIPVFTKKARNGNDFTRTLTAKVIPSEKRFTGKVFVLTSVETASAAEIMTLAAREMPNVTLVGSATEGIFSDILEKRMPNGWEYGLSNEIYETMDGQDYESVGVPPDYEIAYRRWTRGFLEDITKDLQDGDDAIEKIKILMQ